MSYNEPGSEWYRSPTAGICHDFDSGRAQVRPDECAFFDSVPTTASKDQKYICKLSVVQDFVFEKDRLTDRRTFACP